MHSWGKWVVVSMLSMVGGCLVAYDYDDFDDLGSSTGTGGMGGSGGTSCPSIDEIACDKRPPGCPMHDCFRLEWAERAGNEEDQHAAAVAVDDNQNVAIAGDYNDKPFAFGDLGIELLPSTPSNALFTEAFVAYYSSEGKAKWARSIAMPDISTQSHRKAVSVGFVGTDKVVVAGRERFANDMTGHFFLQTIDVATGMQSNTITTLGTEKLLLPMDVAAMATDNESVFLLGAAHQTGTVSCNNGVMTNIAVGVLVIKFDSMGQCVWTHSIKTADVKDVLPSTIAVRVGTSDNLWITGLYKNKLTFESENATLENMTGMFEPFVAGISKTHGTPVAAVTLSPLSMPQTTGSITPLTINFDDSKEVGNTTIFLGGEVRGAVPLLDAAFAATQAGAFITSFDIMAPQQTGIPSTSATRGPLKTIVLPSVADPGGGVAGARFTKIVYAGTRLYASGTFANEIALGTTSNSGALQYVNHVPYLATLETSTLRLLGFDYFRTNPDGAKYGQGNAIIDGSDKGLVMAGTWLFGLDLTTDNAPLAPGMMTPTNGQLDSIGIPPDKDVYLARLTPLP